jgi:hypothetical protein
MGGGSILCCKLAENSPVSFQSSPLPANGSGYLSAFTGQSSSCPPSQTISCNYGFPRLPLSPVCSCKSTPPCTNELFWLFLDSLWGPSFQLLPASSDGPVLPALWLSHLPASLTMGFCFYVSSSSLLMVTSQRAAILSERHSALSLTEFGCCSCFSYSFFFSLTECCGKG